MKKLTIIKAQEILMEILSQMEELKNVHLNDLDDFTEYLLGMTREQDKYMKYKNIALEQFYSSNEIIFKNLYNAISAYQEYQLLYVKTKKDKLNEIYFQKIS